MTEELIKMMTGVVQKIEKDKTEMDWVNRGAR